MQIHGNIWAVDSSKSIYLSNSQIHHQVNTAWDQQVKKIVIMADSSFKALFFNTLNSLRCTSNLTKKHLQFTFHGIPHSFADVDHACSSFGVQYEQHWAKNISHCRGLICTLHCKHASTCFWNWSIRPSKAGSCEQRTISAHDLSVSQLEAGLGKGFSRATPPVSRNRHSWSLTSPLNTGRNMSVSRSNPNQQEFITLFFF